MMTARMKKITTVALVASCATVFFSGCTMVPRWKWQAMCDESDLLVQQCEAQQSRLETLEMQRRETADRLLALQAEAEQLRATVANDRQILKEDLPEDAKRVYLSKDHMGNFIDCVKSRENPICPARTGHRSASLCHLGVIAIRLGRKLNWDPVKEQFIGDDEANGWVSRPMRKPYDYDMI